VQAVVLDGDEVAFAGDVGPGLRLGSPAGEFQDRAVEHRADDRQVDAVVLDDDFRVGDDDDAALRLGRRRGAGGGVCLAGFGRSGAGGGGIGGEGAGRRRSARARGRGAGRKGGQELAAGEAFGVGPSAEVGETPDEIGPHLAGRQLGTTFPPPGRTIVRIGHGLLALAPL